RTEPQVQCADESYQPDAEFRAQPYLERHRRRADQEEQGFHVLHLRRMAYQGTEGRGPYDADGSGADRRLLEIVEPGWRPAGDLRSDNHRLKRRDEHGDP